jgi:hypothetical protein
MSDAPQIHTAWLDFCDRLRDAGRLLQRPTTPGDEATQATGARLLARNIALALQFHLDNNDPLHPELMHYFDPIRKQGGDNTDAIYVGSPINGTDTYVISGTRGSARYFAITVLEDGATPWGGRVVGSLFAKDVPVDADGRFRVTLSPTPQVGAWIRTTPSSWRVTVRQFFADWVNEEPMRARIDRIAADPSTPPPAPTAARVAAGLAGAARWVDVSLHYWADMLDRWQRQPHRFLSYRELDDNAIDATPGGEPLIAYWKVQPGEALIVRVHPPRADWWGVEFGNYWWETMDYRYRLCSTNCHHAALEDDGELIVVVSHEDPGLPNWLDAGGYREGYLTFRWIGADHYPRPECRLVPAAGLASALPPRVRRITPAERAGQLSQRRAGILRRFGH